jgi:HK97 family phage prohead protease
MTQWKQGDRIECDLAFEATVVPDAPDGLIKGIASTAATDLYGHKVLPGAFDDSIRRKGLNAKKGVKLLLSHDWHKPAGVIKRLETVNDKLEIEAQLSLKSGYVRDLYEVAKDIGGLNFSVGFSLEEFEFVDEDQEKDASSDDAWLIIKKGDLMEVSVVCFPACVDAEMTYIKRSPPNSLAEFEKALVAEGLARSREQARKLTQAVKNSVHLFQGRPPQEAPTIVQPHLWLDAHKLKAATDLAVRAKALLGSR